MTKQYDEAVMTVKKALMTATGKTPTGDWMPPAEAGGGIQRKGEAQERRGKESNNTT